MLTYIIGYVNMNEASVEISTIFRPESLETETYPISDLHIFVVRSKASIEQLDALMDMGWSIMTTWIEDKNMSMVWNSTVTDVSIRLGKNSARVVMVTDLPIAVGREIIPNLDADEPGTTNEIITGMRNPLMKLRAASMSGYGPYAPRCLGATIPTVVPKLSIVGLDIEVTTIRRGGGMPLPHDPIISIVISNGGWYDKRFEDKCYCIYAFGVCDEIKWPDERNVSVIKVSGNEEAVRVAYETLNSINADFVNIHNGFNFDLRCLAASCALDPIIGPTIEERRLGNVGVGIFWKLKNGTMVVDSMYTASSEPTTNWPSLSLAKMGAKFDLPPKMDSGTMAIPVKETTNITNIVEYNARDSDLHAWLCKEMNMCERLCMLAGASRGTMWDSIANNTAVMMFCLEQSHALSKGMVLDLGKNTSVTDDRKYEGGFVVSPVPGCYEGVIMIDGNSLYGSLMKHLQIFVDRCVSASTIESLRVKTSAQLPEGVNDIRIGDVMWNNNVIAMRTKHTYISVLQGDETLLGEIITMLMDRRTDAKREADKYSKGSVDYDRFMTMAQAYKLLLVSVYGSTGGKHSILSSRVCAEAITCAARYYTRNMITVSESMGYRVIYGDTDSIFPHINARTENECMDIGRKLKENIDKSMIGTPFENVKADIKGNYRSILITTRKKYAVVNWDGTSETKGMTPVKRDTLPIAKYVATRVLDIIHSQLQFEVKKKNITMFLGKIMRMIEDNKLPVHMQVTETKVNCQPHYKYKSIDGGYTSTLVDAGVSVSGVDKKWVLERITGAISTILEAANMGSVAGLIFSYNEMIKLNRNRNKS
ncbi:MAG: hypothetical protein Q9187_001193 [Circinaria calcarea]